MLQRIKQFFMGEKKLPLREVYKQRLIRDGMSEKDAQEKVEYLPGGSNFVNSGFAKSKDLS